MVARILVASLFVTAAAHAQSTWYVDDSTCPELGDGSSAAPFCTIGHAVDAASNGDTILVLPGVYDRITYSSKALTIRSDADGIAATFDPSPQLTTIDGGGIGPVVDFPAGSVGAVLEGFTLINGATGTGGAGIRCIFGSVIIRGNVIGNCSAAGHGAGIEINAATATIEDNTIYNCNAQGNGGGIYVFVSSTLVRSNRVTGCLANRGGGIYIESQPTTVEHNVIADNRASDGGAGLWLQTGSGSTVRNNLITRNIETKYGGAGLFVNFGTATIVNNVFAYNQTSGQFAFGGAALVNGPATGTTVFDHNTMIGNSAKFGGAMVLSSEAKVVFRNGIMWGNTANVGTGAELQGPCTLDVEYSDIQNGAAAFALSGLSLGTLNYGAFNDSQDPLFVSPHGPDGAASTWQDNDFHVLHGSPCIDKANPLPGISSDYEGDPRPIDGDQNGTHVSDMGADEWNVHLYHLGTATPGGSITLGVTGSPGAFVFVYAGSGALANPIPLPPFGNLLIAFPIFQVWVLPAIPPSGSALHGVSIPSFFPVGGVIYLQGLIGTELTNMHVVDIHRP